MAVGLPLVLSVCQQILVITSNAHLLNLRFESDSPTKLKFTLMERITIGIDPGNAGGVAILGTATEIHNMPETYPDIYNLFKDILGKHPEDEALAVLEDVGHGLPGQSSKATAVFARHNGHLEMALYALGIRTIKVTPQKWQKSYSNSLGKSSQYEKREWKNRLKGLAQQMFPSEKVTLKNADALLIANYGKGLWNE